MLQNVLQEGVEYTEIPPSAHGTYPAWYIAKLRTNAEYSVMFAGVRNAKANLKRKIVRSQEKLNSISMARGCK
jgi:hypothetical protein